MELIAFVIFFASVAGIAALFTLKWREEKRGVVYAAAWRVRADEKARVLKEELLHMRVYAEAIPPFLMRVTRHAVHESALGFAAFARSLERNAYKLADTVSHKHRFEVRAPRSEFLKQVIEHKNGIEHGVSAETTLE